MKQPSPPNSQVSRAHTWLFTHDGAVAKHNAAKANAVILRMQRRFILDHVLRKIRRTLAPGHGMPTFMSKARARRTQATHPRW